MRALEAGKPGRDYVLGGPNLTLTEWLTTAAGLIGASPPRFRIPYGLATAIGVGELALARWFGRAPLLTPDVVNVIRCAWEFSSERARSELGYEMTSLEDGLRQTLESLAR